MAEERITVTQKIIAVVNQKGGVGKTTTAINVAAQLAGNRSSVLLVDLDPQGNATSGLAVPKESAGRTTYDVLCRGVRLVDTVQKTNVAQLFVLPANSHLAGAEVELVGQPHREFALKQALQQGLTYDYIVIDCPPSLGLLTINALTAANQVLIPVQAEYYALEGLSQLLNTIQAVRGSTNPQLELLGIVLTMFDKRNSLSEQVQTEVKNYFGEKLFKTIIPRNVRLAEAPSYGRTIYEHDRWSKGARSYKALAKEVKERLQ
ncbi:MAG TPA: ParA family protein [Candidatus Saccharimonadales bacterium]|nr:ParA family protein [Candidatus Saccharimonadales bacterium]